MFMNCSISNMLLVYQLVMEAVLNVTGCGAEGIDVQKGILDVHV
jgi:hypothetical protein